MSSQNTIPLDQTTIPLDQTIIPQDQTITPPDQTIIPLDQTIIAPDPKKYSKFDEEFNKLVAKFEKGNKKGNRWDGLNGEIENLKSKLNDFSVISNYDPDPELKTLLEEYIAVYKNCIRKCPDMVSKKHEKKLIDEEIRMQNDINIKTIKILMNQELRSCMSVAEFPITEFHAEEDDGMLFLDCVTTLGKFHGYIEKNTYKISSSPLYSHEFEEYVYGHFLALAVQLSKFEFV